MFYSWKCAWKKGTVKSSLFFLLFYIKKIRNFFTTTHEEKLINSIFILLYDDVYLEELYPTSSPQLTTLPLNGCDNSVF